VVRPDQPSYLKDSCNRVRYSITLPSSIFTSSFTTSAMRRSRSVPAAVWTALLAASSQDCALVPITSVTLYTESVDLFCLAIMFLSLSLFDLPITSFCRQVTSHQSALRTLFLGSARSG